MPGPMIWKDGRWQPISLLTDEERRQLGLASERARRALLLAVVALGAAGVSLAGTLLLWICSLVPA